MLDAFLAAAIFGGIEQASQNAINRQNSQARMYGVNSERLDAIQAQQDIQKRIQQIHMKNQVYDRSKINSAQDINDSLAKYAMCLYITCADGIISANEIEILNSIASEISNRYKSEKVNNELMVIRNTPNMDFIVLEKYLDSASPQAIVSCLSLLEEVANKNKKASSIENECIFKIRKYLTDRTGTNYITNTVQTNKTTDAKCPGCAATMEFVPYAHRFECPYCGNVKFI